MPPLASVEWGSYKWWRLHAGASPELLEILERESAKLQKGGRMSDYKWDEYRSGQLADLETVLKTVKDANNATNFIKRMAGASVLAESLLDGTYPSFMLFLQGQQREQKRLQRQIDELHEILDLFERDITNSEDADATVNQIVVEIHRMRELHQCPHP